MAKANKPSKQDLREAMKSANKGQASGVECSDELFNTNLCQEKECNKECEK